MGKYAIRSVYLMGLTKVLITIYGKVPFMRKLYYNSAFVRMREEKRVAYLKSLPRDAYPAELKKWYKSRTGNELDLENPQTFSEKIQWLKLYDSTPLKTKLADKYLVREWIAEKIGEEHLIPLLGVWNSFDEINFNNLPDQFVLKTNHGSGQNIIVKNKASFDKEEAKESFEKWLSEPYGIGRFELHYFDIPRKIVAERYLENSTGELPDYKLHCYSGKVEYIQCMTGRASHETLREKIYDISWNALPFVQDYPRYEGEIKKPLNLPQMISLAEKLATEFTYVRVDFYSLDDGSIMFGEMTFTPGSGIDPWSPEAYNLKYGQKINIKK